MRKGRAILVILLVGAVSVFGAEKPITNANVLEMTKAQLGDDLIVAKIQQAPSAEFDVSTDALIALKKDGVSKAVMDAMLRKVQAPPPSPSQVAEDPGAVYLAGSGAAPYMTSVLDEITDYLVAQHVPAKQFRSADGESRTTLAARLKDSKAAAMLYFTLDTGQGQEDLAFKGIKLRVQCVNANGEPMWEERAEQMVWGTMDTAVKSLTKKMQSKLKAHVGKDGLPLK